MLLTRLSAEGLLGGPLEVRTAERFERVADAERLAEACELLSAALDRRRLLSVARRLGVVGPATAVGGDAADPDLVGLDGHAVRRIVDGAARAATIEVELALDPTLFGRLREHAHREPRIGAALGQSAPLVVKVGWFFSRDHATGSPTLLHVHLGDVVFETTGKDRPAFLGELTTELGRRIRVTDPFTTADRVAARLLRAGLSPDPVAREGHARVVAACAAPPFSLPTPQLVDVEGRPELCFGPGLASLRRTGRAALDRVRWLADAFVGRPDVWVVAEPVPSDVADWLRGLVDLPEAPIEQVWVAEDPRA